MDIMRNIDKDITRIQREKVAEKKATKCNGMSNDEKKQFVSVITQSNGKVGSVHTDNSLIDKT